MFIDTAKVNVKAGDGGNGCTSFYRDRFVRIGRPDGGDGGNGGDAIIQADNSIHTLLDFQYRRHFKAQSGKHGSSNNKRGKNGSDCIIKVPCGTIIRDQATKEVFRDLVAESEKIVICRGGAGGKGNTKKGPGTQGDPGETKDIILELKLIADVGIVGYPNAGKSTLISKISDARPKIASYPFTTKEPVLGVVRYHQRDLVIADIPGLIEGAHEGRGLGDKFLRHIERTKLLLHLVDIAGVDGRDPIRDYQTLNKELALYSQSLMEKPQVLAANKIDIPDAKENLKKLKDEANSIVFPISALTGEGVDDLLKALVQKLYNEEDIGKKARS